MMYRASRLGKDDSNCRCKCQQRGSSLIEVMVALFVLAIGLLGVLSMQVKSMQYTQSAFSYSQAAYLASEILESMRGNKSVVNTYVIGYDDVVAVPAVNCNTAGVICTPAQLKALDLYQWRKNIQSTLSAGQSEIQDLGDYFAIKVKFDDSRSDSANAATPTISEYVMVTEIK